MGDAKQDDAVLVPACMEEYERWGNESKPVEAGPGVSPRKLASGRRVHAHDGRCFWCGCALRFCECPHETFDRIADERNSAIAQRNVATTERDAALERVAELEAQLAEADAAVAEVYGAMGPAGAWMRCLNRHRARQEKK